MGAACPSRFRFSTAVVQFLGNARSESRATSLSHPLAAKPASTHAIAWYGLFTKIHPLFELGLCAVADVLAGFGRRGTAETRHYGEIVFEK